MFCLRYCPDRYCPDQTKRLKKTNKAVLLGAPKRGARAWMRLDVGHKGQLHHAVRKVAAVLALGATEDAAPPTSDETEEEEDAPEQETLQYPRTRLSKVARAAIVSARIARTRADLTAEGDDSDDDDDDGGLAAQAVAAARVAEAAAANAAAAALAASEAAAAQVGTGRPSGLLPGPNPNTVGHQRLYVQPSKPAVVLDPVPPEIARPLRVGGRTFRPGSQPRAAERASQVSLAGSKRSHIARQKSARDSRSKQLPGWQQTRSSAPRVTGQTKVTEYRYVVDTGGLAVDGGSFAPATVRPTGVQQPTTERAARASSKTRRPSPRTRQLPSPVPLRQAREQRPSEWNSSHDSARAEDADAAGIVEAAADAKVTRPAALAEQAQQTRGVAEPDGAQAKEQDEASEPSTEPSMDDAKAEAAERQEEVRTEQNVAEERPDQQGDIRAAIPPVPTLVASESGHSPPSSPVRCFYFTRARAHACTASTRLMLMIQLLFTAGTHSGTLFVDSSSTIDHVGANDLA